MFKPLSLFISLRYARSRQQSNFISFISRAGTIGIWLGSMVLIVALSVMNGFQKELVNRLLSVIPHVEFIAVNQPIRNWPDKIQRIQQHPGVTGAAPVIKLNSLVQKGDQLTPVEVRGISPELEQSVSQIHRYLPGQNWSVLASSTDKLIVLGDDLAKQLDISPGDKLQLLIPRHNQSFRLKPPKVVHLTLAATFNTGGQPDQLLAFVNLSLAESLADLPQGNVQGLRISVDDVFNARAVKQEIGRSLNDYVYMHDWFRTHGHLYRDIQLVRLIMYIVLTIVIAVACFNIVSTLIMSVKEKRGDIAILKTLGAQRQVILTTFILQGLALSLFGLSGK